MVDGENPRILGFSPDGQLYLAHDGSCLLACPTQPGRPPQRLWRDTVYTVPSAAWFGDSRRIAMVHSGEYVDGGRRRREVVVEIRSVVSGRTLRCLERIRDLPSYDDRSLDAAFLGLWLSPGERALWSWDRRGVIRGWDLASGRAWSPRDVFVDGVWPVPESTRPQLPRRDAGFALALGWPSVGEPLAFESFAARRRALILEELERGVGEQHRRATEELIAWARERGQTPQLMHGGGIQSCLTWVAPSPDGRYIAASSTQKNRFEDGEEEYGRVHVWEVDSGRCVAVCDDLWLGVHNFSCARELLGWRSDSRALLIHQRQGEAVIWAPLAGSLSRRAHVVHERGAYFAFAWAPDGERLALITSSEDERDEPGVIIHDLRGAGRRWIAAPWLAKTRWSSHSKTRWSDDGADLIQYGHPGCGCQVIRLDDGARILDRDGTWDDATNGATLPSFDGRLLFVFGDLEVVVVATGERRMSVALDESDAATDDDPQAAAWTLDGALLAVARAEQIDVFELGAATRRLSLPVAVRVHDPECSTNDYAAFGEGTPLAWSRDARLIAATTAEGVEVWQLDPPAHRCTLPADPATVGLVFAHDDASLVTWTIERIEFWELASGRRFNQVDVGLRPDTTYCGDQGHPLARADGNEAHLTVPELSFATQLDDGAWAWVTAFPSGLIVIPEGAPEAVMAALRRSLSLVFLGGFGWPAHWALGTDLIELRAGPSAMYQHHPKSPE